jgi:hypothetical protein
MEFLEKKQAKWNELKDEFFSYLPENVTVEIDWGNEDNEYFHPKIKTDIGEINGRCDLNYNHVYAIQLKIGTTISNGLVFTRTISLDKDSLKHLFENIEDYKPVIERISAQQELIQKIQSNLNNALNDLVYNEFEKVVEKNKNIKTKREIKREFTELLIDLENAKIL